MFGNVIKMTSFLTRSSVYVCVLLFGSQTNGTQRNDERLFPFSFTKSSRNDKLLRLYVYTHNTLSLPPPNGTVDCQLYPSALPRVLFHIFVSFLFIYFFFLLSRK